MSKKFKFSIKGNEFQLPISQVRDDSYNNEKYIYICLLYTSPSPRDS